MKTRRTLFVAAVAGTLLLSTPAAADELIGDKLGTVHFEVGGRPDARALVVRGVKLVHHMMYVEADREFAAAIASDPACALAYWGRAMTILHPLWPDVPTDAERRQGAAYLGQGLALASATPRERAYLETLDRYFHASAEGNHVARLQVLDQAWAALAEAYPKDLDAVAFSALYHLAPARFAAKDKSHRIQIEAATRLQAVAKALPDHPGAQHYKIHAYDFPLLADRALEVCDTYTAIAPDVPHALHMPSHIYTRRGYWDKSISFNLRAAEAARKIARQAGALNSHLPHSLDYLAYAYLQRGQYQEADAVRRQIASFGGPYTVENRAAIGFALSAVPARYALERQAWREAADLPLRQPAGFSWGGPYLNCDSVTRFARAIGAARLGRLDAARTEIAALDRLREEIVAQKGASYWVAQAETQALAARAWVAFAEKKPDEAIALMRRATVLEATTEKEAVTPGEVLPAGDLLGDLLLEAGQPAEALAAFEAVLEASPNRLNTLWGAGQAAERAGDKTRARRYYEQLVTVAAEGDAGIARVEHARAQVAAGASSGQP